MSVLMVLATLDKATSMPNVQYTEEGIARIKKMCLDTILTISNEYQEDFNKYLPQLKEEGSHEILGLLSKTLDVAISPNLR